MTANAIAWGRLQEERRTNRAKEVETNRSNLEKEAQGRQGLSETYRHNLADEGIRERSSQRSLEGTKYSANTSAAASRYGADLSAEAKNYATNMAFTSSSQDRISKANIASADRESRETIATQDRGVKLMTDYYKTDKSYDASVLASETSAYSHVFGSMMGLTGAILGAGSKLITSK